MSEPQFTHDWISGYWPTWERLIPHSDNMRILEIGCFEGRSTLWFLNKYPGSSVIAIDTFKGSKEHIEAGIDFNETQIRFLKNVFPYWNRIWLHSSGSQIVLPNLLNSISQFDVVLVDGSHQARDVLFDVTVSWRLLKKGGVMIMDDYGWGGDRPEHDTPKPAIDAFLKCHEGEYSVLEKGYQVLLMKTV